MKTFLKSLPVFFSFLALEFFIYFFIFFCFSTDFVTIDFLRAYPLILRIPVFTAFFFSSFAFFISKEHSYLFLAVMMNMVFLGFFFEINLFQTMPSLIDIAINIYYRLGQFFKSLIK